MENEKIVCKGYGFCYCKALCAVLIIVLVGVAPSWSNIAITILAALILVSACGYFCRKKKSTE